MSIEVVEVSAPSPAEVVEVSIPGLRGPQGEPGADGADGADGAPGTNGADGAKGDKGDKGDPGDPGADGAPGPDGLQGIQGDPGADGADGVDGRSAYEVAVDNGYVGTEGNWLVSLIGAPGENGEPGAQGNPGEPGEPGADGADGADGAPGADGADGLDGRGITSVARTSGDGSAGSLDTYTITFTDASTTTFQVRNGANGTSGGGEGFDEAAAVAEFEAALAAGGLAYAIEVMADTPELFLRLGDLAGTTAADSSGNGRHGSYSGGYTLGLPSLLAAGSDRCVDFWGSTPRVTVPYGAWTHVTAISVECLFSADVLTGTRQLVAQDHDASPLSELGHRLRIAAGKIEFILAIGGAIKVCASDTVLAVDTTYHIVGTWDGATMKVYINGALDKSFAAAGALNVASGEPVTMGGLPFGDDFDGRIDEVALYGHALTADRIAAHYDATGL